MKKYLVYIPFVGNENRNLVKITLVFSAFANFRADEVQEFVKIFRGQKDVSVEINEDKLDAVKKELDELGVIYNILS